MAGALERAVKVLQACGVQVKPRALQTKVPGPMILKPYKAKYLHEIIRDGAWKGSRAFVIGGGPSLKGFDFDALAGECVITTNRGFEACHCSCLNVSVDLDFWTRVEKGIFGEDARQAWLDKMLVKVFVESHINKMPCPEQYHMARLMGDGTGVGRSLATGVTHGGANGYNSGYAALDIAICLGANPIYLLGFDMKGSATKAQDWWYKGGYPTTNPVVPYPIFLSIFQESATAFNACAEIVNLNPDSALECFPKKSLSSIPPTEQPLYVSFFTAETPYAKIAESLKQSCRLMGVELICDSVPNLGSWQRNTQYKAQFLLEKSLQYPKRALVWIDCDAVLRKRPWQFADFIHHGTAFGATWLGDEMLGGTLFFGASDVRVELLREWVASCEKNPTVWDQRVLQNILPRFFPDMKSIMRMPHGLCYIFDNLRQAKEIAGCDEEVYIEHMQASRTNKNSVVVVAPIKQDESLSTKKAPLVSIMMPARNAEKMIEQAIRSCLSQTYRDIEVLVVDDMSDDKTREIASMLACEDTRVKILSTEKMPENPLTKGKNRGIAVARNVAWASSSGEFIARLDADDHDDPNRIQTCVTFLQENPCVDCVSTGFMMGPEGHMVEQKESPNGMVPDLWMRGLPGGAPCNASIVARRSFYDAVGPFNVGLLVGEDTDWVARATAEQGARWGYIPAPLYYYRRYPGQSTARLTAGEHTALMHTRVEDYREKYDGRFSHTRTLAVFATRVCSLKCDYCSEEEVRADKNIPMHTTPEDVARILKRLCENKVALRWVEFFGGEPCEWRHLEACCRMVKDAGILVRLFSSCSDSKRLDKAMGLGIVDEIYTTLANTNTKGYDALVKKFGKERVFLDKMDHFKPVPNEPLTGVLPAECYCDRLCVIGGRVYQCSNALDISHRLAKIGSPVSDDSISCDLDEDWVLYFRNKSRHSSPLCSICLANRKVWRSVEFPSDAPKTPAKKGRKTKHG